MGVEVQIIEKLVPGREIDGPVLRPTWYLTAGALDHKSGGVAVALTIVPAPDDPVFKEPLTVMVAEKDVDLLVKLLRTAQGLVPATVREGGGGAA